MNQTTSSNATPPRGMLLPALGLLALTFALNANALTAFFVGDDFDFLRGMEQVGGLREAVAFSFWGEWEPVWWVSWYADYRLWGARPLGFHLTNVLWSAVCAIALFGLVRSAWPRATFAAGAAALLFATHPIHDEAITYLAARGHPMATGLALAALWSWARLRVAPPISGAGRTGLAATALFCAFLAALAKETALVLPAWAGALECALAGGPRATAASSGARLRRGLATAALFAVPAAATLALRWLVVGLGSDKLTGGVADPARLAAAWIDDLPLYALLSAFPLPLALVSEQTLERLFWLGWLALLAAGGGWIWLGRRVLRSGAPLAGGVGALQMWGVGIVIFVTGLAPVVWADLGLRRRYAFASSIGAVLIAAALLYLLHTRAPRAARAALALLVVLGSAATWQRNQLYVRSGALAEGLLTTLRGAPLDQPAREAPPEVALLTLPRAYGGDNLSGAYLLHHTDLSSALRFYDGPAGGIHYALKAYHADDYVAEARFEDRHTLRLDVSFSRRQAFDDAADGDPAEDRFGNLLFAELESADGAALRLRYIVHLRPGVWDRAALYLYGDGALTRLTPPDAPPGIDLSTFGEP